jgi:hypothetical protein
MQLRKGNYKLALIDAPDWVPVRDYEGLYEVHWRGVVRNAVTKENLVPGLSGNGYLSVGLHKNKVRSTKNIHRLTATAFIANPENKKCVNHKNGIKVTNHIANLEWNTHVENNRHATELGLRKIKCTPDVVEKIVSMHIRADKNFGAKALAKIFNIDKSTIHEVLNTYKYVNRN